MTRALPSSAPPDTAAAARSSGRRPSVSMLACGVVAASGVALTALYGFATSRMFLTDFFPAAGFAVGWIEMLGPGRRAPAIAYVQFAVAALALYAIALVVVWRWSDRVPRWLLLGFPVLFAVALIWMYPPNAASDLFHYHADARTAWIFGENPLVFPPGDTDYPLLFSWNHLPSPYGPGWSLLTGIFAPLMVPKEHFLATLIGFKFLAAASYLGGAWIIFRIVSITHPGRQLLACVLFAWSPFVLLRVVGNGHNDLVMMFFALLALLAARRSMWTWLFLLLSASMLIKFSTALLGPPCLLYAWHRLEGRPAARVRALAPGLALGAGLAALAYAPFWAGAATFDPLLRQTELMITSIPDVLGALLAERMDGAEAATLARGLTILVFGLLAIRFTWQARRGFDSLVVASFHLMFFYLLIAAAWFRPWYMLWPATLIALYPTRWGVALFLAITTGNLFPDLIEHHRYDWGMEPFPARVAPVIAQFALPAVVWVAAAIHTRSLDLGAAQQLASRRAEQRRDVDETRAAT